MVASECDEVACICIKSASQEAEIDKVLEELKIDTVILARYMQVCKSVAVRHAL